MPRRMRDVGSTGWVHIILRGINREDLFYDEEDYERFVSTLARFKRELAFEIPVFCLMSNHVHLLMFDENGAYAQAIKKIAVSYAAYYNKKYDRVGHVFQDRFRSEPVKDERYLLSVARYIYRNPEKAGICPAREYPYTFVQKNDGILTGYFSSEEELTAFLETDDTERHLEYDTGGSLSDAEAAELLRTITGSDDPQYVQRLDRAGRDTLLLQLKKLGLTVRQISRLTGVNRNVVQRA